ncbi:hypothetical protein LOZ53_004219 [Ophidiomyces ophidiicola]|uniref:Uncharacterized protein n=1 Tax=Ophidiomyces ophidiicola TaxID=1387563 RepID=A0ACB8UT86_9EURO|nr:hypothetical protein LOZ61_006037 [Ophidiomyces ophidiicola]KAI1908407.1 hypothetical protein LOZ64_005587 [Ophidiomyces ophidiicola]KAI1922881.1 hypothetical protein LOZ60_005476 [Ophidiomyces ophidiicola]KAI1939842.1 hypothetical protein LOZ62_004999 [Ophidiomyces ophidiicola]KAI1955530.1 hypothetical protein LOZ59_004522 [Ophidiomyces ophidiicola]
MSKSKSAGPSGGYHQEYIASLRYRNDLPVPDMPPKFLEVPHEGLEHFLSPGFTANMVRREELNIDVDAEGGMTIDLVGIPGLHLGDESAIMAPDNPPTLDPADLPLLMNPEQLRNPAPKNANVSFLRRTQYIATTGAGRNADSKLTTSGGSKFKVQKPKPSRDEPLHIKKYIIKGFDIAYPKSKHIGEDTGARIRGLPSTKTELDAWATPVHPDNPKLEPVGCYPIIPDVGGFPDPGGFLQFKFDKAPVQSIKGRRDDRMDIGILLPSAPEERVSQDHASKIALHKANPNMYPDPGPVPWDYDLFLSRKEDSVKNIKSSLNILNSNRDAAKYYSHENQDGVRYHQYDRLRTYATSTQILNTQQKYKDVALVLFKPDQATSDTRLTQKAAYYYPILAKTRLKPERSRTIAQAGLAPTRGKSKEDQIHQIQVAVRDPNESEAHKRASHRAQIDSVFAKTMPPPPSPDELLKDDVDAEGEEVDLI